MKQKNTFGVWHRCRLCGTVFMDGEELRAHTATHPAPAPAPIAPIEEEEFEEIVIPSVRYPTTTRTVQQPNRNPKFTKQTRFAPSWRS